MCIECSITPLQSKSTDPPPLLFLLPSEVIHCFTCVRVRCFELNTEAARKVFGAFLFHLALHHRTGLHLKHEAPSQTSSPKLDHTILLLGLQLRFISSGFICYILIFLQWNVDVTYSRQCAKRLVIIIIIRTQSAWQIWPHISVCKKPPCIPPHLLTASPEQQHHTHPKQCGWIVCGSEMTIPSP